MKSHAGSGETCRLVLFRISPGVCILISQQQPRAQVSRCVLSYENVTYSVHTGGNVPITILDDISGVMAPGTLTAIMGPSGSGKTTLLDILAGKISSLLYDGCVLIDGKPAVRETFRSKSGYVMQDDSLYSVLTVKETLMFSAQFRLPGKMTRSEKEQRVNEVIEELGLLKVKNAKIGDQEVRGISGGERRRVSIGVEMVRQPSIIFLDEPTSGLDSTSARTVVKTLKDIAMFGKRTVVLSIHQPNSSIFKMLDNVVFLSEGKIVYQGPSGNSLVRYFEDMGLPVPPNTNPPDHVIDLVIGADCDRNGIDLHQAWRDHQRNNTGPGTVAVEADSDALNPDQLDDDDDDDGPSLDGGSSGFVPHAMEGQTSYEMKGKGYATSFAMQLLLLCHRNFLTSVREKNRFILRFVIYTVVSFVFGTLFLNASDDEEGVNNIVAFLVFCTVLLHFTSLQAVSVFIEEREIFKREFLNNTYRMEAFVLSRWLLDIPFLIALAFVVSTPAYWLIGLTPSAESFLIFVTIMFLSLLNAMGFVVMISAFVPNAVIGTVLGSTLMAMMFLFNGFFIPRDNIPDYYIWFHYMSILKYPLQAAMLNQFPKDSSDTYSCENPIETPPEAPACEFDNEDVLERYDMQDDSLTLAICIIVIMGIGFRLMFYLILLMKYRWRLGTWLGIRTRGARESVKRTFSRGTGGTKAAASQESK
eukprot:TRINITY_DN1999_c0_g1_i2.p1 TRINITY_DN1999_c0_g1~~TRINITY_DN1999_c0_g1_i2.p1  ORF type:complete len:700 (+),score=143.67 TRINITY_DN1999_c0_g1_i2:456-2555(+)